MNMRSVNVIEGGRSVPCGRFDLSLSTLGYERRSTYLARTFPDISNQKTSLAFPEEDYASYMENRDILEKLGHRIVPYDRDALAGTISNELNRVAPLRGGEALRLMIDISSMDRPLIARTVESLRSTPVGSDIDATFVYCPAQYVAPNHDHAPVAVSEPVIPEFAGWTAFPGRPITAVVGAGYERDLALGALEFLEPASAWAFFPTGEDQRYDRAVEAANKPLREILPEGNILEYDVKEPLGCLVHLEGLVYGLVQNSRTILLPFGPKVFFLSCILVASIHAPSVTVWRVSGEKNFRPGDRIESGSVVTLRVMFTQPRVSS
jgi:hypothetical protein